MFLLTDNEFYIGKDFHNRPVIVNAKEKAALFKNELAAVNYLNSIPEMLKNRQWKIWDMDVDCKTSEKSEGKEFGNPTKATVLEKENIDVCEFFSQVIQVMSQLERFIFNMQSQEQIADMKILDIRHYIRDNEHRLNAI